RAATANNLSDLSSTYDSALGFLKGRVAGDRTIQRDLQQQVEALLKGGGVRSVIGAYGNGTSTLLRAAIASVLGDRRNRPIIYFDGDLRTPGYSMEIWMTRQLTEIAAIHPVLLPTTSPTSPVGTGGTELARWLRDASVSIVIDNVPYHLVGDDEAF